MFTLIFIDENQNPVDWVESTEPPVIEGNSAKTKDWQYNGVKREMILVEGDIDSALIDGKVDTSKDVKSQYRKKDEQEVMNADLLMENARLDSDIKKNDEQDASLLMELTMKGVL